MIVVTDKTKMTSEELQELKGIVKSLRHVEASYVFASIRYDELIERSEVIEKKIDLLLKDAELLLGYVNESGDLTLTIDEQKVHGYKDVKNYANVPEEQLHNNMWGNEITVDMLKDAVIAALRQRSSERVNKPGDKHPSKKHPDIVVYKAFERHCFKITHELQIELDMTYQGICAALKKMAGDPWTNRSKLRAEQKAELDEQ